MKHIIYSVSDVLSSLDAMQRVIDQSRDSIAQKNWPQLNSKLRKIDDELRYAMRVGAVLGTKDFLGDNNERNS